MNKAIYIFITTSLCLSTALFAAPGGGGGGNPGGGGNQPVTPGGTSSSFTYDTFLTDASTSSGIISYDGLWTGFVAGTASLTAPSTVTGIVAGVLAGNTALTTLDLSSATKLTALPPSFCAGCTALTTVILPSTITEIGEGAFEGCASLTTLTASGVTKIGSDAFRGCTSLTTLPSAAKELNDFAFAQSGLTSAALAELTLGDGVCVECTSLTSATAPDELPNALFAGCTNLTTLTTGFASLGTAALAGVPLAETTIPSSVTLGDYALAANESPQALVLTYDGATLPTTNATTFLGRTLTLSYTPTEGSICRVEAKPLVDWLTENATSVTQPTSYASADLRTWLSDADNLIAFLYADSLAEDDSFLALTVSGTSFIYQEPDAAATGVVTATLQYCTDLTDADWQEVTTDDLTDGTTFTPETDAAFARILYTIPW